MATDKSFLQKMAEFVLAVIFWWPISVVKVCKNEARFEGLTCTALCLIGLVVFFTFKGKIIFSIFILLYLLLGVIFSQKFFWINSPKESVQFLES